MRKIDDDDYDIWWRSGSNEHNIRYLVGMIGIARWRHVLIHALQKWKSANIKNQFVQTKTLWVTKKHCSSIMSPLSATIYAAATKINTIIFWFLLVLIWSVQSNWNQYPVQRRCMLSSIKYYPLYSNRFVSFRSVCIVYAYRHLRNTVCEWNIEYRTKRDYYVTFDEDDSCQFCRFKLCICRDWISND